MGPEGTSETPQDKREHPGLAARLKEMIAAKPKDGDLTAEQIAYRDHKEQADAKVEGRQADRQADLQARLDSGETPVVPADERYTVGTGEQPAVTPDDPSNVQ